MSKKKKSSAKWIILGLLALIAFIAVACGFFYAKDRSKKDVLAPVTTSEGRRVVTLLDESTEAQRLLDNILLQKSNWQLKENQHEVREVAVSESEAQVKIHHRDLAVGLPVSTSLTGAGAWLKEKTENAGLVFISGRMTEYKTWEAFKAEIGIKTKAGDGSKNFVTDTIYFFHNTNLQKQDKDIKKLPDAEPEPVKRYTGKLAVIVDDCGYDLKNLRALLNTGLPFSYAIIPYKNFSSDALEAIKSKGRTAMLHLPMEPMDAAQMSEGANTVRVSMTAAQKTAMVRKMLASLQGVSGVNNHQGSKATADEATMRTVLQELKKQKLFFVDSRTNSKSVARDTAKKLGVPTARNDIFLDNSSNPENIRRQIYKACEMAEKNGSAIAICHVRPGTVKAWQQYGNEIRETGIRLVPVTELLY